MTRCSQTTASLVYLPISEAILLSFLIPIFTFYACSPFRRHFHSPPRPALAAAEQIVPYSLPHQPSIFTPSCSSFSATWVQRFSSTSIHIIRPRTYPLITVNYYGFMPTLIFGGFLFQPFLQKISFRLPQNGRERTLLFCLA